MKDYTWWLQQKRRVQKKYTLFLGWYLSPKERKEWYKRLMKAKKPIKRRRIENE
ncbi:MAG: hypothetical protein J6D29_04855 [Solobacterium sp.]|nr:hypothetical protein [Solobacterium sp.]